MTRARDVADTQDNLGGAVAPFVAGKNKLINGDFSQWQRGSSFSVSPGSSAYTADRFSTFNGAGGTTCTQTRQTFTPGAAPVSGYEGTYFHRTVVSGFTSGNIDISQAIEDVRTLAGQTVTVSLWAKASASVSLQPFLFQSYGSGGSGTDVYTLSALSLTTSWQRFTMTVALGGLTGKTIGTNNSLILDLRIGTNMTLDLWGVQIEAGNVATPFTPAGGGFPGAELALCQRYYQRLGTTTGNSNQRLGVGPGINTTVASITFYLPTKLRTATTAIDYSTLQLYAGSGTFAVTSATLNASSDLAPNVNFGVASGLTGSQFYEALTNGNSAGYIGFTAEL